MRQKNVVHIEPDLQELVPGYLKHRQEEIELLLNLLSKKDWDGLGRIAHKLKGNAGGYGFEGLGKIAEILEAGVKNQSEIEVKTAIQDIRDYLSNLEIHYDGEAC